MSREVLQNCPMPALLHGEHRVVGKWNKQKTFCTLNLTHIQTYVPSCDSTAKIPPNPDHAPTQPQESSQKRRCHWTVQSTSYMICCVRVCVCVRVRVCVCACVCVCECVWVCLWSMPAPQCDPSWWMCCLPSCTRPPDCNCCSLHVVIETQ